MSLFRGNAVDAAEEVQVLRDREVVVERKLLRHVADLLPDFSRAKCAALAGKLHVSRGGFQQTAQHLDRRCFSRAVGAQQSINFAVAHLQAHVVHRGEGAEFLRDMLRADRDLAALTLVVAAGREGRVPHFLAEGTERRDKRVFKRGSIHADAVDRDPFRMQDFFHLSLRGFGRMREQIQAVSEALHVKDVAVGASYLAYGMESLAEVGGAQFDAFCMQTLAKFVRRADLQDLAEVKQSNAIAPLRFVEIGSGNQHGEALAGEVRERVPKLAPGHGIHACRRFIQEQNIRLGNERAHERQLLLHAAAQLRRETLGKAVHVEHF